MTSRKVITSTRWLWEPLVPSDERLLIRQIVGLLAEVPLPEAEPVAALRPSHLERFEFAQVGEPLSYRAEPGVVPALPQMRVPRRRLRKARDLRRERSTFEGMTSATGDPAQASDPTEGNATSPNGTSNGSHRPGTGGRQKPLRAYSETTATAELYEKYGEPFISKHGDATMMVWLVDAEGDGIIGARLSTRDVQKGETALGQVHPALEASQNRKLKPKWIVVTTENSGGLPYDERCDFELIEREIYAGRCRWVWFRDVRRLIRNVSPFYRFRDTLLETNTDLWLTDYAHRGGPIDWDADDIQLGIEAILAERDRKNIYSQTHGPLMTRWLGEGRGWPGAKQFGYRRNDLTNFLEVDPEQWMFVRMIFETYVATEKGKGKGVRAVKEALAAAGCELSDSTIKRVLADPIYVTGEDAVCRDGKLYEIKPIELDDPIAADLFEEVQQLLKLRKGKEERNPAGFFPLNGLAEHSCGCRLRARTQGARQHMTYTHYPEKGEKVCPECRGWSVGARDLEQAVIREVRRLAKCQKLQEEWAALARPQFADPGPILDDSGREALLAEIEKVTQTYDRLTAGFIDKCGKGQAPDDILRTFHKLTAGCEQQLAALNERLARAEMLDSMRQTTRPAEKDPLLDVFLAVLTEETPDDPKEIRRRGALLESCISKVVVYDKPDGSIEIVIHGPLVPGDLPPIRPLSPIMAGREHLIEVVKQRNGSETTTDAEVAAAEGSQPGHKSGLTVRLAPSPALPKLGRPIGRRGRRKVTGQLTPGQARVAPAWTSARVPVLREGSNATTSEGTCQRATFVWPG